MNFSMNQKIYGVLGLLALVALVIAGLGIWQLGIVNQNATKIKLSGQIQQELLSLQRAEKNLILARNEETMKEYDETIKDLRRRINDHLNTLSALSTARERRSLDGFRGKLDDFFSVHHQILELALNGRNQRAVELSSGKGRDTFAAAEEQMEQIVSLNDRKATRAYVTAWWMIGGVSLVGLLSGLVIGWWIIRGVTQTLERTIEEISAGSEEVAAASEEVSASSQNLAQVGSENASAVEETSSSLEEITAMVRRNTENANKANQMAQEAQEEAEESQQRMQHLQDAMQDINQSSEKISNIIDVIEEIAFQTNILALNAAVEAARAGEHGKGFAVVAEEVRSLAERSAEAAQETSELIEEAVDSAQKGSDAADRSLESMEDILASSREVAEVLGEVATASNEQSQGIDQINEAIGEIDQGTQEVASNAEEASSASEELSAQAVQMQENVQRLAALVDGDAGGGRLDGQVKAQANGDGTNGKVGTPVAQQPLSPQDGHDDPGTGRSNGSNGEDTPPPEEAFPLEDEEETFQEF